MSNNTARTTEWVDAHMSVLSLGQDWQPDMTAALARLHEQQAARAARRRSRAAWPAAALVVACVCVAAFRPVRSMALRCLSDSVASLRSVSTGTSVRASNLVPRRDRKSAPDFTLRNASSQPVSLSNFKGRVVLLNFWATWCHGCGLEIPWFIDFESNYKSSGLSVVGISMDDDGWSAVKPFIAEKKINYAIVLGNEDARTRYALGAMPMTLLIDRQGKIAATHVGVVSQSDCKSEIESLLGEK